MGIFDFAEGPQKLMESSPLSGLTGGSLFPDFRSLFGLADKTPSVANMSDAQANSALNSGLDQNIFPFECPTPAPSPAPSPSPENAGSFFQFSFSTNSLAAFDDALKAIETVAKDLMGGGASDTS